ncbi:hypothetical protein FE257_005833 [Aspergillus nanangensis]|uniref:VOC domain-containing protein n=1 Tax=Aspergillus nanangensis TaxID=2582783 RepID=A0AAD4GWE0_ASPNN|nr:hypothetical protein FE257_005833 [Aspergillus nanangensis]
MAISQIQVAYLAHVHYSHPNLDDAVNFLQDFGLIVEVTIERTVYLRGYGKQPFVYVAEQSPDQTRRFLGGYWVVQSEAELQKAATHPDAISSIEDSLAPGGGRMVRLRDPNGFIVGLLYGQQERANGESRTTLRVDPATQASNEGHAKPRKGSFRRFHKGASPVHKLGHYGFMLPQDRYQDTVGWYYETLNLKPSDYVVHPETGEIETVFNHIDLGDDYTDHHSFFLASSPDIPRPTVHHSSFEINDHDTQVIGHDWLASKGWVNCWGIGRHILGSQIFDYWFDASGNIIEHYSDGDLVNQHTPVSKEPAGPQSLYVWGPNLPLAFISGKIQHATGHKVLQEPDVVNGRPAVYSTGHAS